MGPTPTVLLLDQASLPVRSRVHVNRPLEAIKTVVTGSGHQDDEDEEGLGHMTAKPLKNSRKYVDSGFVHDMMDTKTEEHYFLKAHVWPSMRNELPHNVLIILSGQVVQSFTHHASPAKSLH